VVGQMQVALLRQVHWQGLVDTTDTTHVQSHKQTKKKEIGRAGTERSLIQNKLKH